MVANCIRTDIGWTKAFALTHDDEVDQSSAFVVTMGTDGETNQLVFNADQFRTNKQASGKLTARIREILSRGPAERTEEDVRRLQVGLVGGARSRST